MDTTLIERLARLRGIGDAYHDYRGELRYFSLETKRGILRAMGCAVDEPAALAAELSQLEAARWRKFLPPVAAARGSRIGIDINVTAREFGSSLVWRVHLEDGSQRDGVTSTADCREIWRGRSTDRGSPAGASSCRSICPRVITNWKRKSAAEVPSAAC